MKILSYTCHEVTPRAWSFSRTEFGDFNLLVGTSASGKTRFLNTIFNAILFAIQQSTFIYGCWWEMTLESGDTKYVWTIETEIGPKQSISMERLVKLANAQNPGEVTLVDRTSQEFMFRGSKIPRLSPNQTSIFLLREEPEIKQLFEALDSHVTRRRFFGDEMGKQSTPQVLNKGAVQEYLSAADKRSALIGPPPFGFTVSTKLYLLSEGQDEVYSKQAFRRIKDWFQTVFPSVVDLQVRDNTRLNQDGPISLEGFSPMVCIREKGVDGWIPYSELSSGMQKVLLILTDLETLPEGTVYLIDEYENSLGVNAINFLPDYLAQVDTTFQLFITSHHPYLINRVDPRHWYVFSRNGSDVRIRAGDETARLYGASKQDAFMQLINDPFYSGDAD